jgi:nickel-type superoxide dismutase maturation protease
VSSSTRPSPLASALRAVGRLFPFARYRIEGESMAPSLQADDRVIVNKLAYKFSAPRPGDLVVLYDPRSQDRLILKRIERAEGARWRVLGDNQEASTDSRSFGAVSKEQIVGKVWFRY